MSGNEEFIQEFLVECEENLDQLDQDLVALEETPRDPERLASVFRTIHTIKGTSGFFGFAKLGAVTHAGEHLLGRLRDGELILDPELTNALLQLVDTVREILAAIEQQGAEGDGDFSSLISKLEVLAAQPTTQLIDDDAPQDIRETSATESDAVGEPTLEPDPETRSAVESEASSSSNMMADVEDQDESARGKVVANIVPEDKPDPADRAQSQVQTQLEVSPTETPGDEGEAESEKRPPSAPSLGTVRVDVGLLDELMNQVGELVFAHNQIRPFADRIEDHVFGNALQQLDLITGDLQEGIMKTRMQPIGNLWTRLPRVVRDLAQSKGKQVQLEMYGRETELDRTLIEAIKDPLTHLVRNAVDHGIEFPDVRQEAGKPSTGTVVLRAFHEGGLVNIEISDDGGGIDPERVRSKALRQGLITPEQARRMSGQHLTQLIFLPGFSTAEQVTDTSGRGVGMDVVKTNIERIGGAVAVESRLGSGTTLHVKIPLTLAIIPVLMVTSGGQRFAIPQVSLREIVTLFEGSSSKAIEPLGDALVFRLRGELLPLIQLSDVLRIPNAGERLAEGFAHVIVLEAIGQRFGMIVDQISRSEEIVVKPLHKTLAQIPVFSGATVLGDGQVAVILDMAGVARAASVQQREQLGASGEVDEEENWEEASSEFGDYLICETSPGCRVAVLLEDVTRLEEFAAAEVQADGDQFVISYRNQLMPLLRFKGYALPSDSNGELVYLVVHGVGARHVGLLMHRILDVSPATQLIDTSQKRPGTRGKVLVEGQILDVVDIAAMAQSSGIVFATNSEVSP